jgi:hypothetical protein
MINPEKPANKNSKVSWHSFYVYLLPDIFFSPFFWQAGVTASDRTGKQF